MEPTGSERTTGDAGAVTFVQRFGSALNLDVHFHMLFLDGACVVFMLRTLPASPP